MNKVLDHVKTMLRMTLKDPADMVELTNWLMAYTFARHPNKDDFFNIMTKASEFYSSAASMAAIKEDNDE